MNSEKVKDIKKALECCGMYKYDCEKCPYKGKGDDDDGCGDLLLKDTLTLISELEMENQSLKESIEYGNEVCKECQSDKDKGVKWKLKRFAQMLFEKYSYDKLTHEPDEDIEIHLTASELDETLKEMIENDK